MDGHGDGGSGEVEETLAGGNMGGATRVGDTVRRPAGPWTTTIQRLLGHLECRGVTWTPSPLGSDDRGREVLTHLPGLVPQYPLPGWIWNDEVLVSAARLMAQLHEATVGFDRRDGVWQLPAHEPADVICHNDFAPYNMVFIDGRLTGVIDWDTASPGPRLWDLAYLAYRLVPLTDPANLDGVVSPPSVRGRRLRLLCDAYGKEVSPAGVLAMAVVRLEELAAFTEARVQEGKDELRGHVELYRRDARWIGAHSSLLQ